MQYGLGTKAMLTASRLHGSIRVVSRIRTAIQDARTYSPREFKRYVYEFYGTLPGKRPPPISSKPASGDEDLWITEIDRYLPLDLRSGSWNKNLDTFEGVRSIEHLPQVLQQANEIFQHGALTYMALVQRRWTAALYLCEALLSHRRRVVKKEHDPLKGSPWSTLRDLGRTADIDLLNTNFVTVELYGLNLYKDSRITVKDEPRLSRFVSKPFLYQNHEESDWIVASSQIHRCLGHVMLAAHQENTPLRVDMSGFVLQVIAAMHTHGIVDNKIYQFENSDVSSIIRKPPFLHLMSSRIMTALADKMWKKAEVDIMRDLAYVVASHAHKGDESPARDMGPRLEPLQDQIWIEWILWSCVYARHFQVGVELVAALYAMPAAPGYWRTTPWNELQVFLESRLEVQQDKGRLKSWFDRIASSHEGYSAEPPLARLGRRRISREVLLRLCEGSVSGQGISVDAKLKTRMQELEYCMAMLGPPRTEEEIVHRRHMLWNFTEQFPEAAPYSVLQDVLMLRTNLDDGFDSQEIEPRLDDDTIEEQRSIWHSLLVQQTAHHVARRDPKLAMISYRMLRSWSGNPLKDDPKPLNMQSSNMRNSAMNLRYLLPSDILAALLDITMDSRLFIKAKVLVKSMLQQFEAGWLQDLHRQSTALVNALLVYMGATGDKSLLRRFFDLGPRHESSILNTQSRNRTFREVLHLQLREGQWANARAFLAGMSIKEFQITISAKDIFRIGGRILFDEHTNHSRHAGNVLAILSEILAGNYLPPAKPGENRDLTTPRFYNTLAGILATVPSPRLSTLQSRVIEEGPISNQIHIRCASSLHLLNAIVRTHGMNEGRQFMEQWFQLVPGKIRVGDANFRPILLELPALQTLIAPFITTQAFWYNSPATDADLMIEQEYPDWLAKIEATHAPGPDRYRAIIDFYYHGYPAGEGDGSDTVVWAMELAAIHGHDNNGTFQELLARMDESYTAESTVDFAGAKFQPLGVPSTEPFPRIGAGEDETEDKDPATMTEDLEDQPVSEVSPPDDPESEFAEPLPVLPLEPEPELEAQPAELAETESSSYRTIPISPQPPNTDPEALTKATNEAIEAINIAHTRTEYNQVFSDEDLSFLRGEIHESDNVDDWGGGKSDGDWGADEELVELERLDRERRGL